MPLIPAFKERQRLPDLWVQDQPVYVVRPCLKKKEKRGWGMQLYSGGAYPEFKASLASREKKRKTGFFCVMLCLGTYSVTRLVSSSLKSAWLWVPSVGIKGTHYCCPAMFNFLRFILCLSVLPAFMRYACGPHKRSAQRGQKRAADSPRSVVVSCYVGAMNWTQICKSNKCSSTEPSSQLYINLKNLFKASQPTKSFSG